MTIKDRVEAFMAYNGIRRAVFEKSCGFSNGYTRNLKASPSASKIEKILIAYPELNRVWLMTGEGEMIKETVNITTGEVSGNGNSIGSPITQNIGEVSGQNAGRDMHNSAPDCIGEAWLNELAKQRELTEKAQAIAETAQTQLSTALARISDLTDKLLQYLQNP